MASRAGEPGCVGSSPGLGPTVQTQSELPLVVPSRRCSRTCGRPQGPAEGEVPAVSQRGGGLEAEDSVAEPQPEPGQSALSSSPFRGGLLINWTHLQPTGHLHASFRGMLRHSPYCGPRRALPLAPFSALLLKSPLRIHPVCLSVPS
ncbi:hypothetical protein P7K49_011996 [Saguinus oedipus]|uniref:Uncharacterized protein n=1 Tax=Saguinus oedipus TaxID=9490 RepID=A0ABQ9VSA4_SAGOE|nr:hypothetical protein P7K49_011996 [Saguinus oedipus]